MKDKLEYLEDDENRYPMAFSLNVMEAIQEKYGTLQDWGELAQNAKEPNIKALKFMVTEAINEGLDIENRDEKLTSRQVGRLITRIGIQNVAEKINKLITSSVSGDDESKNDLTMESRVE